METRRELIRLGKLYGGSKDIPENKLKDLAGVPNNEHFSRGRLVELINRKCLDELAVIDQADCESMMDSGEMENTGQPQQIIRDRIRDKILDPLEDSGRIR